MLSFLKGKVFIHNIFGEGIVTEVDDEYVTIRFDEGEKKFIFPDSFAGNHFMEAENDEIQVMLEVLVRSVEDEKEPENEANEDYDNDEFDYEDEYDEDEDENEDVIILEEYEIDCDEYNELKDTSDFEIIEDVTDEVSPRSRADVYLNNFYGPMDINELIWINESDYYSNLNSLYKQSDLSWSVPNNAVKGDIVVFMCANSAKAKSGHLCAEIKNIIGTDNDLYDFAAAERDIYKKYSGHIIAWGVLTGFPEKESRNSKVGYADIHINERYTTPVPYSAIKNLFRLNFYGSATKLTKEQWEEILQVIREFNPK